MAVLKVKNTVLGQGQPKIIVSLIANSDVNIYAQALTISQKKACDLIE